MFKKPGGQDGIWGMPRAGRDGSERYEDAGKADGPSGIPGPGSTRLFTLGAERDGASVSIPMSMAGDDGHTEAVPVRERCGTGSEMGRPGASLPAERSADRPSRPHAGKSRRGLRWRRQ